MNRGKTRPSATFYTTSIRPFPGSKTALRGERLHLNYI